MSVTTISGVNNLTLNPLQGKTQNSDIKSDYPKTLQAMKIAHFKTYFEMQNSAKTNADVVVLPRMFKSFHPCPFKLILIEFFRKPLNLNSLPEIFEGSESELKRLHREYQRLSTQSQKRLLESIIEDTDAEFGNALDAFLEKIEEGPHAHRISFLLRTFEKDVLETKELIDFIKPTVHGEKVSTLFQENRNASEKAWTRAIFAFFSTQTAPSSAFPMKRYICELNNLKADYGSIGRYSQYRLNEEVKAENLNLRHDSLPTKILSEARRIASEIA